MEETLEQAVQDTELQAKLAAKAMLENPVFREFRFQLEQMCIGAQDDVVNLMKASVDEKKLSDLNFKLGVRKGLQNALRVIEGVESELNDNDNSPSKA